MDPKSLAEVATKPHILLLFGAVLFLVMYMYYKVAHAPYLVFRIMGVPGPEPRAFYGNTLSLRKMGEFQTYEELYETFGPICGFYHGSEPYLLVVDPVLNQMIATSNCFVHNEELLFAEDKVCTLPFPLFQTMLENEWQEAYKPLASAFLQSKLKQMAPSIQTSCETLVEVLGETPQPGGDLWSPFCSFALEVVCSGLCQGVDVQRGEGNELSKAVLSFFASTQRNGGKGNIPGWLPAHLLKQFNERGKAQVDYDAIVKQVSELVQAHKHKLMQRQQQSENSLEQTQKSFLDLLVERRRPSKVRRLSNARRLSEAKADPSESDLTSACVIYLLVGYEIIATTLAFTSYFLGLHIPVQHKICNAIDVYFRRQPVPSVYDATEDLRYLDMIIQEALRHHCLFPRVGRLCVETCVLNNLTIPEGTNVVVPVDLIHRLHTFWGKPETFEPERFIDDQKKRRPHFSYIPFGDLEGPYNLIGTKFAKLVVKIALIEILTNYKFTIAADTQVPLETMVGTTRKPKHGIHMRIVKRYIRRDSIVSIP